MFHLILAVWADIKIYKPAMLNLVLKCPEMPWYFVGSVSAIAIRWPRLSSTLMDVTEIWDRVHMSEVCQSVTLWSKYIRIYPSIYPSIFAIVVCFSSRCMWSHLAHVQDHSISYRLMLLNTEFPAELWTKKHHSTTEAATRSRSYQKTPLIIFSVLWVELQLPWLRTKQNICRSSALFSFGPVWVCGVMWRPISRLSTKGESSSLLSQRTRRAYSILRRVSSLEPQEFTFHCPGSFCLERCWKRRIQGPKWLLVGTRPHHGSEKHNSSSMLLCISNVVPESLVLLRISATWQVHPQEIISWKTHLSSAPCGKAPKKNTSRQWSSWTLRCSIFRKK